MVCSKLIATFTFMLASTVFAVPAALADVRPVVKFGTYYEQNADGFCNPAEDCSVVFSRVPSRGVLITRVHCRVFFSNGELVTVQLGLAPNGVLSREQDLSFEEHAGVLPQHHYTVDADTELFVGTVPMVRFNGTGSGMIEPHCQITGRIQ